MDSKAGSSEYAKGSWRAKLEDLCRSNQLNPPVYNLISDRRGGRTAWSATVELSGRNLSSAQSKFQARFWYDGRYTNNAYEDVAEVAYSSVTGTGSGAQSTSNAQTTSGPSNGSNWSTSDGPGNMGAGPSYGASSGQNTFNTSEQRW